MHSFGFVVCDVACAEIVQLGTDRVVAFVFGTGDTRCYVILELYAGGNIILTDDTFMILSLLRTHEYDDSVKVAVRQVYPFAAATKHAPTIDSAGASSGAGDGDVVPAAAAGAATEDAVLGEVVPKMLAEAGARAIEGKERKKATLKNLFAQKPSPVADFG